MHYVSPTTQGEKCRICFQPATHKVGEEIPPGEDKLLFSRHNFTAYVCCSCFRFILGDAVFCDKSTPKETLVKWIRVVENRLGIKKEDL